MMVCWGKQYFFCLCFFCSGTRLPCKNSILYRLGKCLKTRGQTSRLHSKKNLLLGGFRLSVSDVKSGGLLNKLGPLCLALGADR